MTQPTDKGNEISYVNTDGGTYIEGDVEAQEFIGRDKHVHGDEVHGNKVIIQRLDPADARNQRNHKAMRQLVKSFWIDGVLKHSLYREVLIRLNVKEKSDAVDNRHWELILQQPEQTNYSLPNTTSVIEVFDQMNQLLLILGDPGSGKTTMMLELADALLKRAEVDPTHPTPVIFNLASWSENRQPLVDWLVDELHTKYNIPKKVAQKWTEEDELLPLLDGLDEVRQEHRNACVDAINEFRQKHFVPMAVCSRVTEYKQLMTQLKLQGAVLVQPLRWDQVDEYLEKAGTELSAVRTILKDDLELQDIATSPLMLSIIVLAYHSVPITEIGLAKSIQPQRQYLFNVYIRRMFTHRKVSRTYSLYKTIQWLAWLAKNMKQRDQTIFWIEHLQPDWLKVPPGSIHDISGKIELLQLKLISKEELLFILESLGWVFFKLLRPILMTLLLGLLFGLVAGIFTLTVKGFDTRTIINNMISWSSFIMVPTFTMIVSLLFYTPEPAVYQSKYPNQGIWQSFRNMLLIGLINGLLAGISIEIIGKVVPVFDGSFIYGIPLSVSIGLLTGIASGLMMGGSAFMRHFHLRLLLSHFDQAPLDFARFLDYCVDRLFLRRVGGGYIFIHRLILEHFASLTNDDIERIVRDVEARK